MSVLSEVSNLLTQAAEKLRDLDGSQGQTDNETPEFSAPRYKIVATGAIESWGGLSADQVKDQAERALQYAAEGEGVSIDGLQIEVTPL
jgi:hypothetical protein